MISYKLKKEKEEEKTHIAIKNKKEKLIIIMWKVRQH